MDLNASPEALKAATATLIALSAVARESSRMQLTGYRVAPGSSVLTLGGAALVLAQLPKPLACIARIATQHLIVECRHLRSRAERDEYGYAMPPDVSLSWTASHGSLASEEPMQRSWYSPVGRQCL